MLNNAFSDLISSIIKYKLWILLASNDIKIRYVRSTLGPFWITLSTLLMVGLMGPLYGAILGISTSEYILYLSISFVIWNFMSITINESSSIFINQDSFIKQVKLPYFFYIFRLLFKNFIIFLHNLIILIVAFYFSPSHSINNIILIFVGIFIIYMNLIWISTLLAILGARYRDINQIVINLVQISFFISPILWKIEMLPPNRDFLAYYNPLFNLIEIVRRPLLNQEPIAFNYIFCFIFMFLGLILTLTVFAKYRSKIAYWI